MTDSERRVVENVPAPRGMNSVLACLNAVLRSVGEDVTYERLMGVSSRAFRLQFSWCPSAPHSHCGFNTVKPALRATGYETKSFPLAHWEPETRKQREATEEEIEAARSAVKASIDAGVPALLNSEECSVLAGYELVDEENPTGWLRRPGPLPPAGDDASYVKPVKHLPWEVSVLNRSNSPAPDREESVLWSLRTAVENARTSEYKGYTMGFAAWERWIRELGDLRPIVARTQEHLEKFDTDESAPFGIQLGNAWCYDSLIDARRCAVAYLRAVAEDFAADAAARLRVAGDAYDQVLAALAEGVDCPTRIAPYPWMEGVPWTQALRDGQAERLRKGLESERKAIEEIEAALDG